MDRAGTIRARAPGGRRVRPGPATAMRGMAGSGPTEENAPGVDRAGTIRARATVRRAGSGNRPENLRPPARTRHGPDPAAASALPAGDGLTCRRGLAMRNVREAHGDQRGEPKRQGPGGPFDGNLAGRPAGPGTGRGADTPTEHRPSPPPRATSGQTTTAAAADRSAIGGVGAKNPGPPSGTCANRAAADRGMPRTITIAARPRPPLPTRRLRPNAYRPSARRGMPAETGVAAGPGERPVPTPAVSTSVPTGRQAGVGIRAPGRPVIRSSCCGLARLRRRF